MTYEALAERSPDEVEAALRDGAPDQLATVVLAAALYAEDGAWAESVGLRLATHADPTVRGNAVLGFGHLARRFGALSPGAVARVDIARSDPDAYVRSQAEAAAADVAFFLSPPEPG